MSSFPAGAATAGQTHRIFSGAVTVERLRVSRGGGALGGRHAAGRGIKRVGKAGGSTPGQGRLAGSAQWLSVPAGLAV